MQSPTNRRIASLLSVLLLALASACGSSKPTSAGGSKPAEKQAASADPSDFCERYKRMYCTHETGDDGQLVETTFDKLTPADQAAVADACQASYSAATEAEMEAMETCLGGVQSCDVTASCITR